MTAADVLAVLQRLVENHGAPLVIKADNGSAFRDAAVKAWAAARDILLLYSPPGTPAYNGACEVTCRWVKVAADGLILAHGLELADALEIAGRLRNAAGPPGKSAAETWARREPVSEDLRQDLAARYREHEEGARRRRGIALGDALPHASQASLDRFAIREALCDSQLLTIQRL